MSDHQRENSFEFSPLVSVVSSDFLPDGVSVGLNSDQSPCGRIVLNKLICTPRASVGISLFPSLHATGPSTVKEAGVSGDST